MAPTSDALSDKPCPKCADRIEQLQRENEQLRRWLRMAHKRIGSPSSRPRTRTRKAAGEQQKRMAPVWWGCRE
jgi:hypothetical protein